MPSGLTPTSYAVLGLLAVKAVDHLRAHPADAPGPPHPDVRNSAMSESAPRRPSRWSRREGRVIRYSAHAAIRSAIASGASMCRK